MSLMRWTVCPCPTRCKSGLFYLALYLVYRGKYKWKRERVTYVMNENEIAHATNGALRVARRQMLQSAALAKKAEERLDLDETGDRTREGVWHNVTTNVAAGHQAAEKMERELDSRDADYKSRSEVKSSV